VFSTADYLLIVRLVVELNLSSCDYTDMSDHRHSLLPSQASNRRLRTPPQSTAFVALEIESLVLNPSSQGSIHNQNVATATNTTIADRSMFSYSPATRMLLEESMRSITNSRWHVRSLVKLICLLVAVAVALNVIASTRMVVRGERTEDKNKTGVLPDHNKKSNKLAPTEAPTVLPSFSPTTSPSTLLPTMVPLSPTSAATIPLTPEAQQQEQQSSSSKAWIQLQPRDSDKKPYPPPGKNASLTFQSRWCDLQGLAFGTEADWNPSIATKRGKFAPNITNATNAWQLRAPSLLLPGTKHAGSEALGALLATHPLVLRQTTQGFFFDHVFRKFVSANEKTRVAAARHKMYAAHYDLKAIQANPSLRSVDVTPGYLLYSTLLPRRVFCVTPWIKLLVVLRNPTDRVFEHYQAARAKGLPLSLKDWLDKDLAILRKHGLVGDATGMGNATSIVKHGSSEEDVAWLKYQDESLEGVIGRSIYEIQLRQWFQAMRAAGKNPSKDVMVVLSDDWSQNPSRKYQRVLEFANLPHDDNVVVPTTLLASTWRRTTGINQTLASSGSTATRDELQKFFRPYNTRLALLLSSYGVTVL
jgi:hypothetical protein